MKWVFEQGGSHDVDDLISGHPQRKLVNLFVIENVSLLQGRSIYRASGDSGQPYKQRSNENLSHHKSFSGYTFGLNHTVNP